MTEGLSERDAGIRDRMIQHEEVMTAVERLEDGLKHHDAFGAVSDDCPVMIYWSGTVYELPHNGGQFTLGDLRLVLKGALEYNP